MKYLTLSGILITLICFFLPWVEAQCGRNTGLASGLTLIERFPVLIITFFLIGMLIILYLSLRNSKEKRSIIIRIFTSSVLLSIIIAYIEGFSRKDWMVQWVDANGFKFTYGFYGIIIGLLLTFIGTFTKRNNNT